MKQRSIYATLILSLVIAAILSVTIPVLAEDVGSETTTSTDSTQITTKDTAEYKLRLEEQRKKLEAKTAELKKKAEERNAQLAAAKEKTAEQRKKSCEERKSNIQKQLDSRTAAAKRYQGVFDKLFDKVVNFKTDKNLTVADYDTLLSNVQEKQAAATAAVEELDDLEVSVDCSQVDTTTLKITQYSETLKSTKEALKAYKTSIKDLLVAVKTSVSTGVESSSSTDDNSAAPSTESETQQ